MNKRLSIVRVAGVLFSGLLITLQTGCSRPAEIPITSASEEAIQMFLEARDLDENLRNDAAREIYSRAIAKDPNFALAYLNRGLAAPSTQDRKRDLEKAVSLAGTVSRGEQLLIEANQAFYLDDDRAGWAKRLKDLAKQYPSDKRAHFFAGIAYQFYDDDSDQAIAKYAKAVDLDPDYAPPYNTMGYAQMANGVYDRAEEAFKNYIRLIPDEPNPYDSMADLLAKTGRYEDAIQYYQKAVDRDPTFTTSQRKIGINHCWMGQFDQGRAAIRKSLEMELTPAGKVLSMSALARTHLYEGDLNAALTVLDQIVETCKEDNLPRRAALYHLIKGDCSREMGDLDAAARYVADSRTQLESTDIIPYYQGLYGRFALGDEAMISARRGDREMARANADELKARADASGDVSEMEDYYGLIGLIELEQDTYERAIDNFTQADQEDPAILYYWAVAEFEMGHQDKAMKLYRKAAHWNEDSYAYSFVRAKALAALKE